MGGRGGARNAARGGRRPVNIKRLNQVHGNRNITVVEETRTLAKPFHAFEPTCSSLQRLVLLSRPPFSNLAPTETKSSGKTLLKSFPGDGFHHSERRPVLQVWCIVAEPQTFAGMLMLACSRALRAGRVCSSSQLVLVRPM